MGKHEKFSSRQKNRIGLKEKNRADNRRNEERNQSKTEKEKGKERKNSNKVGVRRYRYV